MKSGFVAVADSRLIKWLAGSIAHIPLMAYDPNTSTLTCRLGTQLPWIHERAAGLCSGEPPVERKNGTVTYADVPETVAAQLYAALGPDGAS